VKDRLTEFPLLSAQALEKLLAAVTDPLVKVTELAEPLEM
jgi:hypothetical protein